MASQHQPGVSGLQSAPFAEFIRAHPKGTIRFQPFEDCLDARLTESVKKFQIYPAGRIKEFCRHIPYASGKKDFFEKTGRESFEGKLVCLALGGFRPFSFAELSNLHSSLPIRL